jgi:hypothetical protein
MHTKVIMLFVLERMKKNSSDPTAEKLRNLS